MSPKYQWKNVLAITLDVIIAFSSFSLFEELIKGNTNAAAIGGFIVCCFVVKGWLTNKKSHDKSSELSKSTLVLILLIAVFSFSSGVKDDVDVIKIYELRKLESRIQSLEWALDE